MSIKSKVDDIRGKLQTAADKVKSSLSDVSAKVGFKKQWGDPSIRATPIGMPQGIMSLKGLGRDLIDASKDIIKAARDGNLKSELQTKPVRRVLDSHFPKLIGKLPELPIREVSPTERTPGLSAKPEGPVRKAEARARMPRQAYSSKADSPALF